MPHEPQDASSSTREAPDALRRALVSAAEQRDYSSASLHAEVCEYVRGLRDRGLPPEAVVIAVKHAVRESMLGLAPYQMERHHSSDLVDRVVRWCIEEYYGGGPGGPPPH
jgi:hypothetical protein